MKKVILPVLAITMLIAIPIISNATYIPQELPTSTVVNFWDLLFNVLKWFFNIVLIIAGIFIVYAGWQYTTAGGDEEKSKKGLSTLVQALIGVGIALLAKVLIYVVSTFVIGVGYTI